MILGKSVQGLNRYCSLQGFKNTSRFVLAELKSDLHLESTSRAKCVSLSSDMTLPTMVTFLLLNCLSAHGGQKWQTGYQLSCTCIQKAPILYIQSIKPQQQQKQLKNMQKQQVVQTLHQELLRIVDGSAQYRRYFGLIKTLDEKKYQAMDQLDNMVLTFEKNKKQNDQEKQKKIVEEIVKLQRKIYGLSLEKIHVCGQIKQNIQSLKSSLKEFELQYNSKAPKGVQKWLTRREEEYVVCPEKKVNKKQVKQMKMASHHPQTVEINVCKNMSKKVSREEIELMGSEKVRLNQDK